MKKPAKKKTPRAKKCAVCREPFQPFQSLQKVCSPKCASDYAISQRTKAERRELKKRKQALKTTRQLLKEAQDECNKDIRNRDWDQGCISCDKPANWGGQWHASHYRPAGNCGALRFHPWNINKACSECNNHKSGNLAEYRIRLINKIGIKAVEWLESQNAPYKYTRDEAVEIKQYFKEKNKFFVKSAR